MSLCSPTCEHEAATIIGNAADRGVRLRLLGGGSRATATRGLSARALTGITRYHPEDRVITARAGTPLPDVTAALADHGQQLSFEPPDHRRLLGAVRPPTIGGVAATNLSGPRRPFAGAARDSLIGLRFINGRGELIQTGAGVTKNVAGLDLTKLVAGAWGRLGFITEVTFRVFTAAQAEVTIAVPGQAPIAAIELFARLLASGTRLTGAAWLSPTAAHRTTHEYIGGGPVTLLRLEGLAAAIDDMASHLRDQLGGSARRLDGPPSRRLWQAVGNAEPVANGATATPVWRISTPVDAGGSVAADLSRLRDAAVVVDWRGGLIWIRSPDGAETDAVRRRIATVPGAFARPMRESDGATISPRATAAHRALADRLKRALDPHDIFEPAVALAPQRAESR